MISIRKSKIALLVVVASLNIMQTSTAMQLIPCCRKPHLVDKVRAHLDSEPRFQKKNIIFDLGDVLFSVNKKLALTKISGEMGFTNMATYIYHKRKNPLDVLHVLIDFFQEAGYPLSENKYYKKRLLPIIITEWQTGQKTGEDVLAEIEPVVSNIQNTAIKQVIRVALNYVLNAERFVSLIVPNKQGIALLDAFYEHTDEQGNRHHEFYILSNFAEETLVLLQKKYPEIFEKFGDRVVISGTAGSMKPDQEIYNALVDMYSLDREDCLFFDDQKENVVAGNELGIDSLLFA